MADPKKAAHVAAVERYNRAHTTRVGLRLTTADAELLEQLAAYAGQSRTAYIMQAVRERAEHDDAPCGRV